MTLPERVNYIVIAGVGLIGGSVGLALKRAGFQGKIVGLGRRWGSLKNAIDAGAVDFATMDFAEALKDADLLIVCTPVDVIPAIVSEAVNHIRKGGIITDVGSTKGHLVASMEKLMPDDVYFVGAHPMAGSHKTGVSAADECLFQNSICILTPTESTNPDALEVVSDLWRTMGAWVKYVPPLEHDSLIAAASHLPHAVACALVHAVSSVEGSSGRAIDFTAGGFADMTRIAGGSPEVWKGIFLQNADMIISMLKRLENELEDIRIALCNKDEEKIIEKLNEAKRIRNSIRK